MLPNIPIPPDPSIRFTSSEISFGIKAVSNPDGTYPEARDLRFELAVELDENARLMDDPNIKFVDEWNTANSTWVAIDEHNLTRGDIHPVIVADEKKRNTLISEACKQLAYARQNPGLFRPSTA